jgi:hypothetical protein
MNEHDLQRRLQESVDKMLYDISSNKLRPLQKKAYLCSASCFDNPSASEEAIQVCLNNCTHKVKSCQGVIENEMSSFQNKLSRCVQVCQDEGTTGLTPEIRSNPAKMNAIQANMMTCASKCVEKHISMLPSIKSSIVSEIDR